MKSYSKYIIASIIIIPLIAISLWCLTRKDSETYGFLGISTSVLLLVSLILWDILLYYLKPTNFENKKDFIDLLVKIIGGTTLLITLFTAWKSIKDTQVQLEQNRKQFEENQLTTDRQKRDERFFDAIKTLETKDETVRAGAIFALGQIAKQSALEAEEIEKKKEKEAGKESKTPDINTEQQNSNIQQVNSQYWTIMQLLTGFIKQNYPVIKTTEQSKKDPLTTKKTAPVDLSAALTVIGYRTYRWKGNASKEKGSEPYRLNIEGADLRKLLLRVDAQEGANYDGIQFYYSNFEDSNLTNASFNDAVFTGANLRNAVFTDADLTGAGFSCANVENTNFTQIKVESPSNFAFALSFAKNPLKAIIPEEVKKEIQEKLGENQCLESE
jgi:hypothetical protein